MTFLKNYFSKKRIFGGGWALKKTKMFPGHFLPHAFIGALDLSYLGVTIENMEGPTAPITGVCVRHNVPFFKF